MDETSGRSKNLKNFLKLSICKFNNYLKKYLSSIDFQRRSDATLLYGDQDSTREFN